jgi:hypothetical protein
MNFRRRASEAPEINLIPFIDVLLVVLIFLMLSTTYSRYSELQITLPTADADKLAERPAEILVSVAADGRYAINKRAAGRPQHRAADRRPLPRCRAGCGHAGGVAGGHRVGRRAGSAPVGGQRDGRGPACQPAAPDLRHPAASRRGSALSGRCPLAALRPG